MYTECYIRCTKSRYKYTEKQYAETFLQRKTTTFVEAVDGKKVNLTLSVAEDDMGMVIGKHGKIAKAIRTIMKAAAIADGVDVNVEIK